MSEISVIAGITIISFVVAVLGYISHKWEDYEDIVNKIGDLAVIALAVGIVALILSAFICPGLLFFGFTGMQIALAIIIIALVVIIALVLEGLSCIIGIVVFVCGVIDLILITL